ncbi:MAG: nucleoside triphosphate pyrophosphatase [Elusimicrobiota bacterium]
MRLILASASPQRHRLLRRLRRPFLIIPAEVSERCAEHAPRRLVVKLALRKARAVAREHPDALVLGADTVVAHRGAVIVKPRSRADSSRILNTLNGKVHRVYTGVALVDGASGKSWTAAAVSKVKARRLPPAELERFIGKHMDKAGAYAVQDRRDPFIERIEGPRDNVIGLPLECVRQLLRRAATQTRPGR